METRRTRKEVEEYIERQKSPQKEIVKTPRKKIHPGSAQLSKKTPSHNLVDKTQLEG